MYTVFALIELSYRAFFETLIPIVIEYIFIQNQLLAILVELAYNGTSRITRIERYTRIDVIAELPQIALKLLFLV